MCHLSRHIYFCPTKKKIVTVQFRNGMVVYRLHGEYVMFTYKGGNVQHFSCKNRSHHLFFLLFLFLFAQITNWTSPLNRTQLPMSILVCLSPSHCMNLQNKSHTHTQSIVIAISIIGETYNGIFLARVCVFICPNQKTAIKSWQWKMKWLTFIFFLFFYVFVVVVVVYWVIACLYYMGCNYIKR